MTHKEGERKVRKQDGEGRREIQGSGKGREKGGYRGQGKGGRRVDTRTVTYRG
jgi:hypothetical protein